MVLLTPFLVSISKCPFYTLQIPLYTPYYNIYPPTIYIYPSTNLSLQQMTDKRLFNTLRLTSTLNTSNMHFFNKDSMLKPYSRAVDILYEFYDVRLDLYAQRRLALLSSLSSHIEKLSEETRFLELVVSGELVVSNRPREDVVNDLKDHGFEPINSGFRHLLNRSMWHTTKEAVEKLHASLAQARQEKAVLEETTPEKMYAQELKALKKALIKHDKRFKR